MGTLIEALDNGLPPFDRILLRKTLGRPSHSFNRLRNIIVTSLVKVNVGHFESQLRQQALAEKVFSTDCLSGEAVVSLAVECFDRRAPELGLPL